MNIFEFLKSKGKPPLITTDYQSYIDTWDQWYKGKVKGWHDYTEYIGDQTVTCDRKSFDAAKMVCESYANLLLNEKVKFNAGEDQELLDDTLERIKFYERANKLIELTFGLGTGAFVEYLDDKGLPRVKFIRAPMILPLSYDNGEITECAFASNITKNGENYVYVEAHTLNNGLYVVDNYVLKTDKTNNVVEVTDNFNVTATWQTKSDKPCFQIIKPSIVNTTDYDSPMGMSIFGNAIDNLKSVDTVFDSYHNEFVLGIKRVYVSDNIIQFTKDEDGNKVQKPMIDQRVVRMMPFDGDVIQQIDFSLRVSEHNMAMQDQLNYLSSKCGLGSNHFKYNEGTHTTATEIISTNSEKYKSKVKHENGLKQPLINMAKKLLELQGKPNAIVDIVFDDSIIEDTKTKREQAQKEVTEGTRSIMSYLMDTDVGRGLSEEDAKKELELINSEKVTDFTGQGGLE